MTDTAEKPGNDAPEGAAELGAALEGELQALKVQASALDAEAAPPQSDIMATPGGDAGAPEKQSAESEYGELIEGLLTPAAQILAPGWGVQQVELQALSEAWAKVAAHYYPEGVGEMGPWAGAVLCTVAVVGPRVRTPLRLPEPGSAGEATPPKPAPVHGEAGEGASDG